MGETKRCVVPDFLLSLPFNDLISSGREYAEREWEIPLEETRRLSLRTCYLVSRFVLFDPSENVKGGGGCTENTEKSDNNSP